MEEKMNYKLPLFRIYWDEADVKAATSVVRRGTYWAEGPEISRFEEMVAKYAGRKHAVAFANGTTALHAMMLAYGIGPGDEVIVPSFTFISTANAPLFVGAKPIFADIEPETYGLDPQKLKKKISKRTKAIIPVHYAGHPCLIKELKEIADSCGIPLLEDAAESLGAKYQRKMTGAFGDSAMYSFCQNKVVTTGEGGMVVMDDGMLADKLRLLRSHGRSPGNYFGSNNAPDYVQLGFNIRMPTICAAIGLAQVAKAEEIIGMRRKVAKAISDGLSKVNGLETPKEMKGCRHVYQLYTVRLDSQKVRDRLKANLAKAGIMSKVYFDPVHLTAFYREKLKCKPGMLPVTEGLAGRVLSLPLYADMADGEIDILVKSVKKGLGV